MKKTVPEWAMEESEQTPEAEQTPETGAWWLEAEEADRVRREWEEAQRQRREAEEAERLRLEAEMAETLRREAEEAERLQKIAESEWKDYSSPLRHERYDYLLTLMRRQEKTVAENRGWFGPAADRRKAAQARLEELKSVLEKEFPFGPPEANS